jgi:hypothetical protein
MNEKSMLMLFVISHINIESDQGFKNAVIYGRFDFAGWRAEIRNILYISELRFKLVLFLKTRKITVIMVCSGYGPVMRSYEHGMLTILRVT